MFRRVLILGATGVFGRRLAKHLSRSEDLCLILTARSRSRSETLARHLRENTKSQINAIALDRSEDLKARFSDLKPWVVIDCSGPFQSADYRVAEAAIHVGAHHIDLADACDYLRDGASALHGLAARAGVGVYLGASSTPALSAAVADHLADGMHHVDSIDLAITPGARSKVGPAVVEAVLSYAGRPVPVWKNGALGSELGWCGPVPLKIEGLGMRRVALVETFDAELLGQRFKVTGHVRFRAGLEPWPEQRGLELLAWLRARGILGACKALIRPLVAARRWTRWLGTDSGAMVVDLRGRNAQSIQRRRVWRLLARQGDGPNVPVMAAAALVDRLLHNTAPLGAFLAADVLHLAEIEAQMQDYAIETSVEDRSSSPIGETGKVQFAWMDHRDDTAAAIRS